MFIDKVKSIFKKLKLKNYLFIYVLMDTVMPIVAVATSKYLTTYSFMVVAIFCVLFTFFACRFSDIKAYIFLLIPFILYEILVLIAVNNEDYLLSGYQVLLFMLPICLGYYLIHNKDEYAIYTVVLAFIFGVTALTTIIGCIRNPDAARELASTKTSQDEEAIAYGWHNVGGYSFVYAYVLMYPCIILAYKMKKINIFVTVGFAVLSFALVIYAEYTYAMMLLMVSTLLFFVRKDTPVKRFFLLLILFIVIAYVFKTVIGMVLAGIGMMIGNVTMAAKMSVVFLGKDVVENVDDSRDVLYMLSIDTFLENPLFGTLFKKHKINGGHSFILDNLADYGLLGGFLMFLMYRGIFKAFYQPLSKQPGYVFVVWMFLQSVVLSCINTGMWQANLCLYIPIVLCWIYGEGSYVAVNRHKKIPLKKLKSKESQE